MVKQTGRRRGDREHVESVNAVVAIPNQVPYVVPKGAINPSSRR
jgi:hypothetical protein